MTSPTDQWYRIEYMDDPEAEGACMECNTDGLRYVPATFDYEAGNEALTRYLVFIEAMADYPFGDKNAIEGIVNAVLRGQDDRPHTFDKTCWCEPRVEVVDAALGGQDE